MAAEYEGVLVNKVPSEVWDLILSYLDIQQRISVERVCKYWNYYSKVHPKWSQPNSIVFDPTKVDKTPMQGKNWQLTDSMLEEIVMRCGSALQKITLVKSTGYFNDRYKISVTAKSVRIIAKYCLNLSEIELTGFPLSKRILKTLAQKCRKLKTVSLADYDEEWYDDYTQSQYLHPGNILHSSSYQKYHLKKDEISAFVKRCRELKSLTLKLVCFWPVHEFVLASTDLKVLRICHLDPNFSACPFHVNLVVTSNFLQELRLNNCFVPPELLMNILSHCSCTLKILDVRESTIRLLNTEESGNKKCSVNWCKVLQMLENLEELRLHISGSVHEHQCHVKGECLGVISEHLRILDVTSADLDVIHNQFLTKLMKSCKRLEELQLHAFQVTAEVLELCRKHSGTLRRVAFSDCTFNGTVSWQDNVLKLLQNAEIVYLRSQWLVSDEVLHLLANSCVKIRTLSLMRTCCTDEGLSHLSSLPNLKALNVSGCLKITDHGLKILAAQGRLEEFYAQPSSGEIADNLTDDGCVALANLCPNFRVLDVTYRKMVTNNLIVAFCNSIKRGFLRNRICLFVDGTSVTSEHAHSERLEVLRNIDTHYYVALRSLKQLR